MFSVRASVRTPVFRCSTAKVESLDHKGHQHIHIEVFFFLKYATEEMKSVQLVKFENNFQIIARFDRHWILCLQ